MYIKDCESCKISKGTSSVREGGLIEIEGGWVLNHYRSKSWEDNYLGRLALQPKYHRMDLGDLSLDEVKALGINIKNIDSALRGYWSKTFPEDPIKRVYVVYFFEMPFAKSKQKEKWHMHIHLLPRTEKMVGDEDPTKVAAWKILELLKKESFPWKYRIVDKRGNIHEERVEHLMDYLKRTLST